MICFKSRCVLLLIISETVSISLLILNVTLPQLKPITMIYLAKFVFEMGSDKMEPNYTYKYKCPRC